MFIANTEDLAECEQKGYGKSIDNILTSESKAIKQSNDFRFAAYKFLLGNNDFSTKGFKPSYCFGYTWSFLWSVLGHFLLVILLQSCLINSWWPIE
jgi:hypothetical protein